MAQQLALSLNVFSPATQVLAARGEVFRRPSRWLPWRVAPALALRRDLRGLMSRLLDQGYRPERHYMRGGKTPGCRSQLPRG